MAVSQRLLWVGSCHQSLGLDKVVPYSPANQFRGRPKLQFAHRSRSVRFNCFDGDAQPKRDLLIDQPFGDKLDSLALSLSENATKLGPI